MSDNDGIVMVCARADAPWMARHTTFRHFCSKCFTRVMMAPSGEDFLRRFPRAQIVCMYCIPEDADTVGLTADPERILAEMDTAVRNPRKGAKHN